jgi:meso-butanediol dehydrogenase / (S,S)-butanediol dehydrogenase / diacetyl reductase
MTDELAVITGAGSGIGAAVARRLIARGASALLVDRSEPGLLAVRSEFADQGAKVEIAVADVTDEAQVAAAAAKAAAMGTLRTVVACAGVESYGDVVSTTRADWDRTLSVNLTGVFLTAHHTIPLLLESGSGTFTAVASDAGVFGAQGFAAYCASKHGLVGLIKCMALDHGPRGVRSNVICPGFVNTPMAERVFAETSAEERDYYASTVPLGRFAHPAEVAAAVAHLSSGEASYVNGLVYRLDGGSTAGYFRP